MDMKRGLSACEILVDEQTKIEKDFERKDGTDQTIDLDGCEKLITKLSSPFIPKYQEMMIEEDN